MLFDSESLKCLNDFREERVGNLGNNQSEDMAPSGDQGPSGAVRVVAEILDGLPYTLCQLSVNGADLIDGARDGCSRYSCPTGNITDVHASRYAISSRN